jgi:hypothetical protein
LSHELKILINWNWSWKVLSVKDKIKRQEKNYINLTNKKFVKEQELGVLLIEKIIMQAMHEIK